MTTFITITKLSQTTDGQYCYVAYHPEMESCLAQGRTPKEARRALSEMTDQAMEYLRETGQPVPPPQKITAEMTID
jgi:predicted RNase H-like HicB family nuclease